MLRKATDCRRAGSIGTVNDLRLLTSDADHAHFLLSGIAQLVVPMMNGAVTECGMIGCEGVLEGLHLQGPGHILTQCSILAPAIALRLSFKTLQQLFNDDPILRRLILEFGQAQASISCQAASCNAQHDAKQRLSRLLLMTADRSSSPVLPVTQNGLASMLGSQRTTITVVAGDLQRLGLIAYTRGRLKITDRPGLEKMACECYSEIRRISEGLYKQQSRAVKLFP